MALPKLSDDPKIAIKQLASRLAGGSIVNKVLARYLELVLEFVFEEYIKPLRDENENLRARKRPSLRRGRG